MGRFGRGSSEQHETVAKENDSRDEVAEVTQALEELGLSVHRHPEDPIAWQMLGHYLEEMGDGDRARHCYRVAARELVRNPRPDEPGIFGVEPLPFAVLVERPNALDN